MDAEASVVAQGLEQKATHRVCALVGEDGRGGDA